jgi:hypothetical protein
MEEESNQELALPPTMTRLDAGRFDQDHPQLRRLNIKSAAAALDEAPTELSA